IGMWLVVISRPQGIHVAERHEIVSHAIQRIKTAPSLTADTDSGNVQFAVGLVSKGQLAVAENQKSGPGPRRFGQETAAVNIGFHGINRIAGGDDATVSRRPCRDNENAVVSQNVLAVYAAGEI